MISFEMDTAEIDGIEVLPYPTCSPDYRWSQQTSSFLEGRQFSQGERLRYLFSSHQNKINDASKIWSSK